MLSTPVARRAYGSEDKQARRQQILEAARGLFAAGGGSLPAVSHIADAAGVAKGTVYLYFATREEIFADLLLAGWTDILGDVAASVAAGRDREAKVAAFLARFVAYLGKHPELLRLDALGAVILERNMAPAALRRFKLALAARLIAGGGALDEALALAPGRGTQLLMRTYALTRGLWRSFGAEGDAPADPELALFQVDFRPELSAALDEYWRGALVVG